MKNSSVVKIIKTFTKDEITEFLNFLNSPFHNKNSGVVKLYNELKKYYPAFFDDNLDNEKLWSKIHPGKKYNYGVMKNLIFDITKLTEEFITLQDYRSDDLQVLENLFNAMSKRKLNSLIENKSSYFRKKFSDDALRETSISVEKFFAHLAWIQEKKILNNYFQNLYMDMTKDICEWQDIFVTGMLIHLLNINDTSNNIILDYKRGSQTKHLSETIIEYLPEEFFMKVLNSIKKRSKIKFTILNCYYIANKAINSQNDSSDYLKFKRYFFKNFNLLPHSCRSDMIDYLVNYVELSTDVSLNKRYEQYDLYRFRHRNNLFTDKNGQINSSYFVPHLTLLLQQSNLEELEEFIEYYSNRIIGNEKDSCILCAEAVRLFMSSEFEKSLSIISKVKFNSFSLKNIMKKFTLLLYYELNYYEEFKYTVDSYKHFLKYGDWDKKDPGYEFMIKKSEIFINRIDKLFKLRETPNTHEIKEFEKLILENESSYDKWLLNKIEFIKTNQAKLSV